MYWIHFANEFTWMEMSVIAQAIKSEQKKKETNYDCCTSNDIYNNGCQWRFRQIFDNDKLYNSQRLDRRNINWIVMTIWWNCKKARKKNSHCHYSINIYLGSFFYRRVKRKFIVNNDTVRSFVLANSALDRCVHKRQTHDWCVCKISKKEWKNKDATKRRQISKTV